jgi:hypothetical protein
MFQSLVRQWSLLSLRYHYRHSHNDCVHIHLFNAHLLPYGSTTRKFSILFLSSGWHANKFLRSSFGAAHWSFVQRSGNFYHLKHLDYIFMDVLSILVRSISRCTSDGLEYPHRRVFHRQQGHSQIDGVAVRNHLLEALDRCH